MLWPNARTSFIKFNRVKQFTCSFKNTFEKSGLHCFENKKYKEAFDYQSELYILEQFNSNPSNVYFAENEQYSDSVQQMQNVHFNTQITNNVSKPHKDTAFKNCA